MKRFWKVLRNKTENPEKADDSDDIMRVPRLIEPLLNKAALDIVDSYKGNLLQEPVTYIVPAVWGAKEKGKLDSVQDEIHQKVTPVIHEIIDILDLDLQTAAQRFTVGYMIKGLVISKITYMIETLKNRMNDDFTVGEQDAENSLAHVEPIGNA